MVKICLWISCDFRWGAAYKGALSFRCSHYFICFFSHYTALLAGLTSARNQKHDQILGYSITKPWAIELPRSLVDVVVNWNLSMHYWLKTCNLPMITSWIPYFHSVIMIPFFFQTFSCNSSLLAFSKRSYSHTSFHHFCMVLVYICRPYCCHWALQLMPNTRYVRRLPTYLMHAFWQMPATIAHIGITAEIHRSWHSILLFAFWQCCIWLIWAFYWTERINIPKSNRPWNMSKIDGAIWIISATGSFCSHFVLAIWFKADHKSIKLYFNLKQKKNNFCNITMLWFNWTRQHSQFYKLEETVQIR